MKRTFVLFAVLLSLFLTACAVSTEGEDTAQPLDTLTVTLGESQTTFDSASAVAEGSETLLFHLYENLMRWENDGNGYAVLATGQAESYTTQVNNDGNTVYTFTLRDDIKWSDGEDVTAYHFAAAWKRLADPAVVLPHRELMRFIAGYDAVQESGNLNLLGVSAPDALTLVVTLNGNVPHFLETVCASAYTMPIRHNPPSTKTIITNGAYTVAEWTETCVTLTKSTTYYDAAAVHVAQITMRPAVDAQTDFTQFLEGNTQFVENIPLSVKNESEETAVRWNTDAVTTTLALAFNLQQEPFSSAEVRTALRLSIDQQQIVDVLADGTSRAAVGLIPYGVTSVGTQSALRYSTETGDAIAETPVRWDFREHSKDIVTMDTVNDYASDCDRARALLAQAGYPDGTGFPAVEYIFVDTEENALIARTIQAMWQEQLGITVALRALSQEEYDAMLTPVTEDDADSGETIDGEDSSSPVPFQIAAIELCADYNDASALLSRWHSKSASNVTGYTSPAFDILLDTAALTDSADVYDAYLHDAEAILIADAPLVPLCYRGRSYVIADALSGLYHAPNGVYFFSALTTSAGAKAK